MVALLGRPFSPARREARLGSSTVFLRGRRSSTAAEAKIIGGWPLNRHRAQHVLARDKSCAYLAQCYSISHSFSACRRALCTCMYASVYGKLHSLCRLAGSVLPQERLSRRVAAISPPYHRCVALYMYVYERTATISSAGIYTIAYAFTCECMCMCVVFKHCMSPLQLVSLSYHSLSPSTVYVCAKPDS